MAKRFFNARWFSAFGLPKPAVDYLRIVNDDLAAAEGNIGDMAHNDLQAIQGGSEDQRYHLTLAQLNGLHSRGHTMTNASDHTASAWRVFYSNGDGGVVELALGANGTFLRSGGASVAPTFSAPPVPDHNDLGSIQGGTSGQYYHIREPQTAIPDSVGSDEVDRINDILAVLRTHGLIST